MFEVGDVVGSYTILAHLRSGGMADLFLAYREGAAGFRRLVAIKVIHARHAEDEHVLRMFLDEALISARIDHPNVVHVEDLGQLHETYFLVMEYVHGCSLAQLMKELGTKRRRLSPTVAVAIAARIAEGLHAAHETTDDEGNLVALVHRDVSPQNILLSHKGHVKLIDFGVAKANLRTEHTHVAMLKGKVRYMPPEQATTGLVDRRSDVYSLGIVLWEMLTMRRLFAGKTEFEVLLRVRDPKVEPPSAHVDEISPELDRVVLSALAKDPNDRPQSAKEFRRMLARAEPRSMALDSAHLADLVCSTMGDQLQEHRTEMPQEISRLLEAEQLRAAIASAERRAVEEPTENVVDVMTLESDVFQFEEDELDDTPDKVAAFAKFGDPSKDPSTTPDRGPRGGPEVGVLSSEEAVAMRVPTLEEADPTVVGDRPKNLGAPAIGRLITHDEDSEDMPTEPFHKPVAEEPSQPPRLGPPAFQAIRPEDVPIVGRTHRIERRQRRPWVMLVLAVAVSAALGTVLALIWPFGWRDDSPPAVTPGPAVGTPVAPSADAGAPAPDVPEGAPPEVEPAPAPAPEVIEPVMMDFDAGPPPRRRRGRRRRRR